MADNIRYEVTRRGTRYGVNVANMTKTEARGMLNAVVDVKCSREHVTDLERNDILEKTETARSLDPPPAFERWANRIIFAIFATGFLAFVLQDLIKAMLK